MPFVEINRFGRDHHAHMLRWVIDECCRTSKTSPFVGELYNQKKETFGQPTQNAFIDSFNERLRDELLNKEVFDSLRHARAMLARWRWDYNHFRPHSSRGGRKPVAARLSSWMAPRTARFPSTQTKIIQQQDSQNDQDHSQAQVIPRRQMTSATLPPSGNTTTEDSSFAWP